MFASDLQNSELAGLCSLDRNLGLPRSSNGIYQCGSGLLYLPLLLGCLMLWGGSQAGINGLIGCFSLTPLLLGQQEIIRETPFSDWRLGPSIAGAYVVYRQLVLSVLRLKSRVHGLAIDNSQLKLDAVLDPLTATLNRRGFMNGC